MSEDAIQPLQKLLLVDDSRMVRASIGKHLRGRYEIREEVDGEAAWQALMVDPAIELVITDIGMPVLDGYGLIERIRSSKIVRLRDMPVIVISGEEDEAVREKARQAGATDFITKGIGTAELLARLDAMAHLARSRRDLQDSREAHAQQKPVDPASGLVTNAYFDLHGAQELALAQRKQSAISAMVIEIDRFEALSARLGSHVMQLVTRKLAKTLAEKVRKEDTVAQIGPSRFAVLSPSTDLDACGVFALRLAHTIDKTVLTYREERIRITISVGLAGSLEDGINSVNGLLELAISRMGEAKAAGGNRVRGRDGIIDPESLLAGLRAKVAIDPIIHLLRIDPQARVPAALPDIIATLLPLLELIESRTACGMPLAALRSLAENAGKPAPA